MDSNNPGNNQQSSSLEKDVEANNSTPGQQRPNQQKVTKMRVVTKTWTKDSYGLFDYQAGENQYEITTEYLEQTMFIVRDNRTCKTLVVKDLSEVKEKHQREEGRTFFACLGGKEPYTVLGQLVVDRQRKAPSFKLKLHKRTSTEGEQAKTNRPQSKHSHHSKRFIPFIFAEGGSSKNSGYPLFPGNIIKFGRVEYLVLQSFNGKATESFCDSMYYEDQEKNIFDVVKQKQLNKEIYEAEDKDNMNCKICLCNEQTPDDPLISPCKCKGYCGLIHTNCLRTWINNKVKKETTGLAVSYNFTKFECEICKAPFPKLIRTETDQVEMMKIDKPERPYIMLESLDPTGSYANPHPNQTSTEKEKLLHVISTDEKNVIKIGRANECEIRLSDISVSRRHAQIKLVDGEFYIKDTGAKFGTLVEWNGLGANNKGDIILINKRKPLKIQLGRTSYEFVVEDINEDIETQ